MAGCQKEGNLVPEGGMFSVKSHASVPQTKTAITPAENNQYIPKWTSGDQIGIIEQAVETVLYPSDKIEVDAESATFTTMMRNVEADAYTYCAVYPYEAFTASSGFATLVCKVPEVQKPVSMTSFDGAADILVSYLIESSTQPVEENLEFSMRRMTATGMVTIKNVDLKAGEHVLGWTLSTNGDLAGTVNVDATQDVLAFTPAQTVGSVKVELPEAQTGEFTSCFTCLPYTLSADEEYTVTVHTNLRNISKTSKVNRSEEVV